MPIWQPTSTDPADTTAAMMTPQGLLAASRAHHRDFYTADPTGGATAPATWTMMGEHTDYSGGVVLGTIAQWTTAVTVGSNTQGVVNVAVVARDAGGTISTEDLVQQHSLPVAEIAARAAAQQTTVNAHSRPVTPPVPEGGIAARLGGIAWSMIHRQMLSRDTQGLDITVVSTIPVGVGLGEVEAAEVATALALFTDETHDAPTRARLAEVCSQSANMFAEITPLRARHTLALRGEQGKMSVIDYADGSVTQVPHPVGKSTGLEAFVVCAPGHADLTADSGQIRHRQEFIDAATRAFSVESLRLLPDATTRVIDWLQAVIEVAGRGDLPTVDQARSWLGFWEAETLRVQHLCSALRSRRLQDISALLAFSQQELVRLHGLSDTDQAIAELCLTRGALSARNANAGITHGVIVLVDARKAPNFSTDLSDDGLLVVPLHHGGIAEKAF